MTMELIPPTNVLLWILLTVIASVVLTILIYSKWSKRKAKNNVPWVKEICLLQSELLEMGKIKGPMSVVEAWQLFKSNPNERFAATSPPQGTLWSFFWGHKYRVYRINLNKDGTLVCWNVASYSDTAGTVPVDKETWSTILFFELQFVRDSHRPV